MILVGLGLVFVLGLMFAVDLDNYTKRRRK